MRELILTDVTEMGSGQCVVGIERMGNVFQSVRPLPPAGYAWPLAEHCRRGCFVQFEPAPTPARPPHIEDQGTHGLVLGTESLAEDELVDLLQHAETSETAEGLFGCGLAIDQLGGNAWVPPQSATRSICGCAYTNMRFRVFIDSDRIRLMAMLVIPSGEVLHSLPIVDWEWRQWLVELVKRSPKKPTRPELDAFFNRSIRPRMIESPAHFVRIGLPRPRLDESKCWLMLDTLFPQPDPAWLDEL